MINKLNDAVKFYQEKLQRKQMMILPYRQILNSGDEISKKQYAEFKGLEAEINLIEKFIEELEYIGE